MKNDIGKRKWHRLFGWCTITHPYTQKGTTLVDSEYKHVQHYRAGEGWVDYKGTGKTGNIVSIHLHKDELFNEPQQDDIQSLFEQTKKVIE